MFRPHIFAAGPPKNNPLESWNTFEVQWALIASSPPTPFSPTTELSHWDFFHGKFWSISPGKASCDSRATQPTVRAGCFCVSIIHRTLTCTTGSLTCTQLLVVVAFSSLARIFGECWNIHSPPALLIFIVKISSRTLIPLFRPGSIHSGSPSLDDCGRVFPDQLRVSSFPDRFPYYAWTAA